MGCFRLKMSAIIPVTIKAPETPVEWEQYYDLRWQMLRKPWQQARGSEKDELEDESIHRLAIINNRIIAVGRLHFINAEKAQIRYMAVIPEFQQQGIGQQILHSLELAAIQKNIKTITLNAREKATHFYEKNLYKNTGPAHTLYDSIKHVKMKKTVNHQ